MGPVPMIVSGWPEKIANDTTSGGGSDHLNGPDLIACDRTGQCLKRNGVCETGEEQEQRRRKNLRVKARRVVIDIVWSTPPNVTMIPFMG